MIFTAKKVLGNPLPRFQIHFRIWFTTRVLLMIFICATSISCAVGQTFTVSETNVPLTKIFSIIETKSLYQFFYKDDLIRTSQKVTVNVTDASLADVLDVCFKNQPFIYVIVDQTIVVKKKPTEKKFEPDLITVTGKVTDEQGQPVPGVAVTVMGTQKTTVSDDNGYYVLYSVPGSAVLGFSGVNVETKYLSVITTGNSR